MKLNKKLLVFALGLGSMIASAESRLTVNVPFDFVAAGKRMPAANYTLLGHMENGLVLLQGDVPDASVALMTSPGAKPAPGSEPGLRFEKRDGETMLTGISMDDAAVRMVAVKEALKD